MTHKHAQAERPIGAGAARFLGPQEGEPKGDYTSDTKENAEPKGATNQETHKHAQAERPIGASAAQITGPQEGDPKGAYTSDTK